MSANIMLPELEREIERGNEFLNFLIIVCFEWNWTNASNFHPFKLWVAATRHNVKWMKIHFGESMSQCVKGEKNRFLREWSPYFLIWLCGTLCRGIIELLQRYDILQHDLLIVFFVISSLSQLTVTFPLWFQMKSLCWERWDKEQR